MCYMLVFLMMLLLAATDSSPLKGPSCFCRKKPETKISICASPLGDPAWCVYHVCAPGFECVGEASATHFCAVVDRDRAYRCLRDESGSLIHPSLSDSKRCKCTMEEKKIKQVLPRSTVWLLWEAIWQRNAIDKIIRRMYLEASGKTINSFLNGFNLSCLYLL